MPFLKSLPADARLLQLFKAYPQASLPLIDFHRALLRGPSPFTAGQRELLAAYTAALLQCDYCQGVHEATARKLGIAKGLLQQLLADPDQAAVEDRLKPVLRYVRKLTLTPAEMVQADAEAIFEAGWNDRALHDIVGICGLFNLMSRLVQGLGLEGDEAYFEEASQRLAKEGYRGLVKHL